MANEDYFTTRTLLLKETGSVDPRSSVIGQGTSEGYFQCNIASVTASTTTLARYSFTELAYESCSAGAKTDITPTQTSGAFVLVNEGPYQIRLAINEDATATNGILIGANGSRESNDINITKISIWNLGAGATVVSAEFKYN